MVLLAKSSRGIKAEAARQRECRPLAGVIAVADKNSSLAETEFTAALQLEPNNQQLALNVATVRLTSTDPATKEKARAELMKLAEQSALRLDSFRALASDALAHNSLASAEKWAALLKAEKGATFADLLLYLEATHKTDGGQAALRNAESQAAKSPAAASAFITWINRRG